MQLDRRDEDALQRVRAGAEGLSRGDSRTPAVRPNLGPATRRPHKPCANPACRRGPDGRRKWIRPPHYRLTKYCCRQCSADCRSRASRVAAGRKGGTASGVKRRHAAAAALAQQLLGKSVVEAYWFGRKHGKADLGNRVTTARREGFSDGYEQGFDAALKPQARTA